MTMEQTAEETENAQSTVTTQRFCFLFICAIYFQKGKQKEGKVKRKSVKENALQSNQEDAKGKQSKKVKFDEANDDDSFTRPKSTNDQGNCCHFK